jgi:L-iditol 2-dehydrogenase
MKTLAAYLKAPWKVELRRAELPESPPEANALIRVDACGICGTDLSSAEARMVEWSAFGHEIAGTIEAIGPGKTNLKVGDRVVLESSSYCGTCELCRDGRVDLCNKAPSFWNPTAMGFGQRMIAPLGGMVPYDGLTPDVACLAEPAGVAVDMVKTANVPLGARVAVIGPGPIALMAIAILMRGNALDVTCIGRPHSRRRLEVAGELGAIPLAVAEPLDARDDLRRKFDHVLLTSPVETIPPALSLLKYGGTLTYIGMGTSDGKITIDANDFHWRKLQLRASMASPAIYYPTALAMLKSGMIPGEKIISHRFPLEEMEKAMLLCRDGKDSAVKVVVKPNP